MANDERQPSKQPSWKKMERGDDVFPRAIIPVCYQCGKLTAEWWGFFNAYGVAKAICRRCIEEKPS